MMMSSMSSISSMSSMLSSLPSRHSASYLRCLRLLHRHRRHLGTQAVGSSSPFLSKAIQSAGWGRRRPPTAPDCPPATTTEVRALADFISASSRLLLITGAGVSTESSIPDYRSKNGAYSTGFKPMTHGDFMRNDANRRRYWARSYVGWRRFAEQTSPNPAHEAIAGLQQDGHVATLITQNVDRLHHAAGSTEVLELHGTTHEVVCMSCGDVTPRRAMQRKMAMLNPSLAAAADAAVDAAEARGVKAPYDDGVTPKTSSFSSSSGSPSSSPGGGAGSSLRTRPDGDVELDGEAVVDFAVPSCEACDAGGPLKPAVVFFGDSVPAHVAIAARDASLTADAVLIVGSSVSTFSAFRLVRDAAMKNGAPVAILTAGETRADTLASLKVEALAGETLPRVLELLRREDMYGY